MVVDPDDAYSEKAGYERDQLRPLVEQRGKQVAGLHLRDRELKDQQGDRDGKHSIGKSFDPRGLHDGT